MALSMTQTGNDVEDLAEEGRARRPLAGFRSQLYRSLTGRADALFELADAVLCADGPVRDLAGCRWRRSTGGGTARSMTR